MLKYLKLQKGVLLTVALSSVALGALMIIFCRRDLPRLMIWCVAAAAAVFGLIRLARYLTGRGDPAQGVSVQGERVSTDLLVGGGICIAAVLLAIFAGPLSDFIAFVLGAYVAIDGLLLLGNALKLRKMLFGQWKTVMAMALILLVLGVLMVVLPNLLPVSDNYDMICNIVLGAGMIASGAVNLRTVYCLHQGSANVIEQK
ncbi:MAG: hypothetical protein E7554_03830 [Ruminococcaceae bacterium]|nr:hypothetical protein [Oscillospiraceae bacterium]